MAIHWPVNGTFVGFDFGRPCGAEDVKRRGYVVQLKLDIPLSRAPRYVPVRFVTMTAYNVRCRMARIAWVLGRDFCGARADLVFLEEMA